VKFIVVRPEVGNETDKSGEEKKRQNSSHRIKKSGKAGGIVLPLKEQNYH
jgi:hypothetical protein